MELDNDPVRVMLDLDGVVSDYCKRFLEVADELYQIFEKLGRRINCVKAWHFWEAGVGLTKEMEEAVFRETQKRKNFWENLDPLITDSDKRALLELIHNPKYEFYAITARYPTRGSSILVQTNNWLTKHIGAGISVIPAEKKAELCRVLGIRAALEDSPVFSQEIKQVGVDVVLIDREYNQATDHLYRVNSVKEFCDYIRSKY